jgi:hypothetical protein
MTSADTNNDGVLNRRQAEALLLAADGEADKHSVAALVDKIDMDGSGAIDYLKLHRVLGVGPMGLPGSPPALPLRPPAAGASGDPDGPTADARDGSFELGEVPPRPYVHHMAPLPCAPVACRSTTAQRLRQAAARSDRTAALAVQRIERLEASVQWMSAQLQRLVDARPPAHTAAPCAHLHATA